MTDDLDLGGLEAAEKHARQYLERCRPRADNVVCQGTSSLYGSWRLTAGDVRRLTDAAARLRASEAATTAAVERAERAVELLADVHDHAGKMVAAFLDSDRREQLIFADAVNKGHPARFRFLTALPSAPPVAEEKP